MELSKNCKPTVTPMAEVRRAKFWGRDFLPLNASGRIFRLDWQRCGIPVEIVQRRVCAALTGYFGAGLRFPVLREQRVDLRCGRGIDADQNIFQPLPVVDGVSPCRSRRRKRGTPNSVRPSRFR